MKERAIKIGILSAVFILAIIVFSFLNNRGSIDMTADMETATLPTVSFVSEGYKMNLLVGYKNEMRLPTMRDTITPLTIDGNVELNIQFYGQKVSSLVYEVYSLDGEQRIFKKTEEKVKEKMQLSIGDVLGENTEAVLKLTLHINEKTPVYYYTRVVRSEEYSIKECLDYAQLLHTNMLEKTDTAVVEKAIEPNGDGDNTTLQYVTIHSDLEHVTWGKLQPKVEGAISWNIKETNSVYTSIQLKYQVTCANEEEIQETYNVKEFFKIRCLKDKLYLLSYDRTMNQVFDISNEVITSKGITLGMVPENLQYEANEEGTMVAFVQERELWCYDKEDNLLAQIFSFRNGNNDDIRHLTELHNVRIISMDNEGNMTFAVYGYMNRGTHEGEVGAAIYYYDTEKYVAEEKAFIPSRKAFEITEEELGGLTFYHAEENQVYFLLGHCLYKVDLGTGKQQVLVEQLQEGQYAVSENRQLLAYQEGGSLTDATQITLLNLLTGKTRSMKAEAGETIRPLGFIGEDFVYGVSRPELEGRTVSGQSITPLQRLEIRDEKNQIIKTYQTDNVYIKDVVIENNMITMNRLTISGGLYKAVESDYITNNAQKQENRITFESYRGSVKETQYRLVYDTQLKDREPRVSKIKQVVLKEAPIMEFEEQSQQTEFYVYGLGEMQGLYENAGEAIQKADEIKGVVVSSNQTYVWERGNRNLWYKISSIGGFAVQPGESTLAACVRRILEYEGENIDVALAMQEGSSAVDILNMYSGGEAVDLTGCGVEQVFYLISNRRPVIAVGGDGKAVLLVGYDSTSVSYVDPSDGKAKNCSIAAMEEMVAGSGNTFISYVKSQKYE